MQYAIKSKYYSLFFAKYIKYYSNNTKQNNKIKQTVGKLDPIMFRIFILLILQFHIDLVKIKAWIFFTVF